MLAVWILSQVRNDARTAAKSLPFDIRGRPFSWIQYEIGMDDHFGFCPDDAVMRVYAAADRGTTSTKRMNAYFFKLTREYVSDLILKCVDGKFQNVAGSAVGKRESADIVGY